MRALIVDDSRATRAVLRRLLHGLSFDGIAEAGDGRQALEELSANGPADVALVDWNMPVMDGLEFVSRVRSDTANDVMRIVMVTTEADADHMVSALEAGADEYAMKPFTAAVIRDKLALLGVV